MKIIDKEKIIAFLRDPEVRVQALKTATLTDALFDCNNASDYDVFSAICENLFLLAGHPIRDRFLSLIEFFEGEDYTALYLPENRIIFWKRIFYDEVEVPLLQCDFVRCKEKELLYSKRDEAKIFSIESAMNTSSDDIFSLLESIVDKIKEQEAEFLSIDLTKISYARPDDFHACKAYDDLKKGTGGEDIIKLWLVCRVLMNVKLKLILKTDSLKKAQELSELIFRLRLAPKIIVSADIFGVLDFGELYSFIIRNKEKSISASIYASEEMQFNNTVSVVEKLLEIFSCLPMLYLESTDIDDDIVSLALKERLTQYELQRALSHLYRVK